MGEALLRKAAPEPVLLETRPVSSLEDRELCDLVRAGAQSSQGQAAFAELYGRHVDAAMAQAYKMTGDRFAAEDLVAETFTRVLRALSNGNGPKDSALGYVMISLRSEAIRIHQADSGTLAVDPESFTELLDDQIPDFSEALSEQDQIGRAFAELSDTGRKALWLLDVEQVSIDDTAEHLGVSGGAARVLAHRSRKKLATAYLQQYVEGVAASCTQTADKLAEYVRGELGKRDTAKVKEHLDSCPDCTTQTKRLGTLQLQLRAWAGPLLIGGLLPGVIAGNQPTSLTSSSPSKSGKGQGSELASKVAGWLGLAVGLVLVVVGLMSLLQKGEADDTPVSPPSAATSTPTSQPNPAESQRPNHEQTSPAVPPNSATDVGFNQPGHSDDIDEPILPEGKPSAIVDDTTPHWKLKD